MPIDLLELPMPVTLRTGSRLGDEELMRFSERNKPYCIERNQAGEITMMTPIGGTGSAHEEYVSASSIYGPNRTAPAKALAPASLAKLSTSPRPSSHPHPSRASP